jgi:serine/threonine protein kinase
MFSAFGYGDVRGRRLALETSFTDELIGRRLENFVIERLVGVGGMAHVYQARDLLLGREVAIKALSPMFLTDAGYVERFRREAQRVAVLEHQNIAPMLQFIEVDRGLYVVMPLYVESLRELLDRKKRLSISEATRIPMDSSIAT